MRQVTAPDGREWKVGRQWMPRWVRLRPRRKKKDGSGWDILDASTYSDDLGGILVGLALVAIVFVVLFVLFPVVAIALELLLLIVLFIAGLFARVALRKPWHVLAQTGEAAYRWPVKGWRASGERVDEVADQLAAGSMPLGAELLKR